MQLIEGGVFSFPVFFLFFFVFYFSYQFLYYYVLEEKYSPIDIRT